uniref:Uncharacterized protein n=1 Tax=Romanomermis culicivorax TaxID=13658 RepID=A0A915J4C9_ROMCU
LPHFHRAAHFLHVEGAKYPTKVPYTAPRYAYEALEVYFRAYASSLKWLLKTEIPDEAELRVIDKYFKIFAQHPIRLRKSSVSKNVFECNPDVVDCIIDVLENLESAPVPSKKRLMSQCADIMKMLCRKSVHPYYKAYYWLVRFYKSFNDVQACRCLLLGPEQTNLIVSIPCLFNCKGPHFFEVIYIILFY